MSGAFHRQRCEGARLRVMSYLFAALIICFGLMQVELVVLLMLIAAFLFVESVAIYQMVKLEKKL